MENQTENGATLLDEVKRTFERFVVLPEGGAVTAALWLAFAHAHDAFQVSPILTLSSAIKRSGKSQFIQGVLRCLVPNPLAASNVTAASVFHAVESRKPTLLLDEADTWLTIDEQMRGILNAGHTRAGAFVLRVAGEFSVWCPKALALIGDPPSTIRDRSLMIQMRRRHRDELIDRLRADRLPEELAPLRDRVAQWAAIHMDGLRDSDPEVPVELDDRAADNWRPLLSLADLAGGEWPELARRAAVVISAITEEEEDSLKALRDLKSVFAIYSPRDKLESVLICGWMNSNNSDLWGGAMTPIRLARLLKGFGIGPKAIWAVKDTGKTARGYVLADCQEAFKTYLPQTDAQG